MTRGRRGKDGTQGGGFWQPGEYGDDDGYPGRDGYGESAEPGRPPWETGGWQADPSWGPAGQGEPGWQAHPSGPLPTGPARDPHPSGPLPGRPADPHPSGPLPAGRTSDQHPSGPLPPLPAPGQEWPGQPRGGWAPGAGDDDGYPSGGYPQDGYPGGYGQDDYPGGDYQTGGFQTGGFETGGYTGGYPAAADTGGYAAGDYATGGYPAADYTGSGFGDPLHQHDYPQGYQAGDAPEYGGNSGDFTDDHGVPGYSGRDPGNYPGDPDRGGWYSDVDEQQVWTEEDGPDSGFLPGLSGDGGGGGRRGGGGRPGGRAAKRKRSGMRRVMLVLLTVFLLIVVAAGGYGYHLYRTYIAPADFSGPGTGSVVVQIKSGQTAADIGQVLQQKDVVASARAFSNAAKASPRGNALEPGYYRLHRHMQASLAFALLLKPSARVMFKVTIPEGWRESQIIAALGRATGNLAGFQAAARNPAALGLPPYAQGSLEGYLFPATYTIQPGTAPVQVLKSMVQRFGQEAASVNLPAVTRHDQISEHDAIVVASLVQAEGGRVQDFPKIARVIYNRLNSQMQLELDSTVMYALHTFGIMASDQQLNVNSPYNTYRHFGLPPTPIDSPGDAAIQAALHPAAGPWLFFVTVDPKTGVTEFTSDPNVFAQLRAQLQQNVANGK